MHLPEQFKSLDAYVEAYSGDETAGFEVKGATIERTAAGQIQKAKSVKLQNVVFNLRQLLTDTAQGLGNASLAVTFFEALTSDNKWIQLATGLQLLQYALDLSQVELKSSHAAVLVMLQRMTGGELGVAVQFADLQQRVEQDFHAQLTLAELDEVLEELLALKCIRQRQDLLYLTEKVILTDR